MNATMPKRTVNVWGDEIAVYLDGSQMWISPCNGQQHPTGTAAMRAELERYYADCGMDISDEDVSSEIDNYIDEME